MCRSFLENNLYNVITREGGCILDLKTKDLAKSPSLLRMEGSWLLHAVMHSDY